MPMAGPERPTLADSEKPTLANPSMPMMVGWRVPMLTGLSVPALTDLGVAGPEMAGPERPTPTLFQPIIMYNIYYVFLVMYSSALERAWELSKKANKIAEALSKQGVWFGIYSQGMSYSLDGCSGARD